MASNGPPQLHLSLSSTGTSFKRTFEQYGFDLDNSPQNGHSDGGNAASGSSGSRSLHAGSSSDGSERNKRARSTSSTTSSGSSASFTSSAYETAESRSSTSFSGGDHNHDAPSLLRSRSLTLAGPSPPPIPYTSQTTRISPEPRRGDPMHVAPPLSIQAPHTFSPVSANSNSENEYRRGLERFNEFDSHISALRRSRSPQATTPTPPTTLPPMIFSSPEEDSLSESSITQWFSTTIPSPRPVRGDGGSSTLSADEARQDFEDSHVSSQSTDFLYHPERLSGAPQPEARSRTGSSSAGNRDLDNHSYPLTPAFVPYSSYHPHPIPASPVDFRTTDHARPNSSGGRYPTIASPARQQSAWHDSSRTDIHEVYTSDESIVRDFSWEVVSATRSPQQRPREAVSLHDELLRGLDDEMLAPEGGSDTSDSDESPAQAYPGRLPPIHHHPPAFGEGWIPRVRQPRMRQLPRYEGSSRPSSRTGWRQNQISHLGSTESGREPRSIFGTSLSSRPEPPVSASEFSQRLRSSIRDRLHPSSTLSSNSLMSESASERSRTLARQTWMDLSGSRSNAGEYEDDISVDPHEADLYQPMPIQRSRSPFLDPSLDAARDQDTRINPLPRAIRSDAARVRDEMERQSTLDANAGAYRRPPPFSRPNIIYDTEPEEPMSSGEAWIPSRRAIHRNALVMPTHPVMPARPPPINPSGWNRRPFGEHGPSYGGQHTSSHSAGPMESFSSRYLHSPPPVSNPFSPSPSPPLPNYMDEDLVLPFDDPNHDFLSPALRGEPRQAGLLRRFASPPPAARETRPPRPPPPLPPAPAPPAQNDSSSFPYANINLDAYHEGPFRDSLQRLVELDRRRLELRRGRNVSNPASHSHYDETPVIPPDEMVNHSPNRIAHPDSMSSRPRSLMPPRPFSITERRRILRRGPSEATNPAPRPYAQAPPAWNRAPSSDSIGLPYHPHSTNANAHSRPPSPFYNHSAAAPQMEEFDLRSMSSFSQGSRAREAIADAQRSVTMARNEYMRSLNPASNRNQIETLFGLRSNPGPSAPRNNGMVNSDEDGPREERERDAAGRGNTRSPLRGLRQALETLRDDGLGRLRQRQSADRFEMDWEGGSLPWWPESSNGNGDSNDHNEGPPSSAPTRPPGFTFIRARLPGNQHGRGGSSSGGGNIFQSGAAAIVGHLSRSQSRSPPLRHDGDRQSIEERQTRLRAVMEESQTRMRAGVEERQNRMRANMEERQARMRAVRQGLRLQRSTDTPWHTRMVRPFGDYMADEEFDSSYESLLSLAATLGEAKSKATPSDVVASLPTGSYKDWATSDSDQRCPICLDDYNPTDPVLKLVECSHWLHKECLETWLHNANTCPVCRKKVKARGQHDGSGSTAGPSRRRRDDDDFEGRRGFGSFGGIGHFPPGPPPWRV